MGSRRLRDELDTPPGHQARQRNPCDPRAVRPPIPTFVRGTCEVKLRFRDQLSTATLDLAPRHRTASVVLARRVAGDSTLYEGATMRATVHAIGYLRTDISRGSQQWDEVRMRTLAARLDYNLRQTVAFGSSQLDPVAALVEFLRDMRKREIVVEAVVVPGPQHFDGREIPAELVHMVDVITVDPESTYARRATGELPELNGARR